MSIVECAIVPLYLDLEKIQILAEGPGKSERESTLNWDLYNYILSSGAITKQGWVAGMAAKMFASKRVEGRPDQSVAATKMAEDYVRNNLLRAEGRERAWTQLSDDGLPVTLFRSNDGHMACVVKGAHIHIDQKYHDQLFIDTSRSIVDRTEKRKLKYHTFTCWYVLDTVPRKGKKTSTVWELVTDVSSEIVRFYQKEDSWRSVRMSVPDHPNTIQEEKSTEIDAESFAANQARMFVKHSFAGPSLVSAIKHMRAMCFLSTPVDLSADTLAGVPDSARVEEEGGGGGGGGPGGPSQSDLRAADDDDDAAAGGSGLPPDTEGE